VSAAVFQRCILPNYSFWNGNFTVQHSLSFPITETEVPNCRHEDILTAVFGDMKQHIFQIGTNVSEEPLASIESKMFLP
jgi:hypothetical protein